MAFASAADAFNPKLSAYAAVVMTNEVRFVPLFFSDTAENYLRDTHDIRMPRLIIDVQGSYCDFDELHAKANGLMFDIPARIDFSR